MVGILQQDPRPAYQKNADREYGLEFAGYNIRLSQIFVNHDEKCYTYHTSVIGNEERRNRRYEYVWNVFFVVGHCQGVFDRDGDRGGILYYHASIT